MPEILLDLVGSHRIESLTRTDPLLQWLEAWLFE
jgi:hypothetical protein